MPNPSLLQRVMRRMGRPRHEPARQTVPYARLQNMFSLWGQNKDRPIVKATPQNLRKFSRTVYARRAIKVVKDSIATREWEIAPKKGVKVNPELQRQIDVTHDCFARPNNDDSFRSFTEQVIEDILVAGAGALEPEIGGDAIRPLWMWPVDALSIQIVASWDGSPDKARYVQSLGYGNVGLNSEGRQLRNDQLVYIKHDPATDTPFGLGPLEVAFNTINRQLGTAEFAGNAASNATPAYALLFTDASTEDIGAIREYWQNEIEGQGKAPLFGGKDFKSIVLRGTTDDGLFLKYQEYLIREIAAAFGVSPQNLAIERDVNRDTAEVAEDRDWRQTIIPMAHNYVSYLNREVIEGKLGFSQIELRILGLDRDDELDTANIFKARYQSNSITPNEWREKIGEKPLDSPWGNMLFADVQIAMAAARGSAQVDDPDLKDNQPDNGAPKGRSKPKGQ